MRPQIICLLPAILLLSRPAQSAPLRVLYLAAEERGAWQPIEPGDLEATVKQAALEVLSGTGQFVFEEQKPAAKPNARGGTAQAEAGGAAGSKPGDYLLRILGRTVAEAETHHIHLVLEPTRQRELASFSAADSVFIGKLPRAAMLQKIEGSARAAAKRLLSALEPHLATARADGTKTGLPPALDKAPLPWSWAEVRVPPARGADEEELKSGNEKRRQAAVRALASLALTDASPRRTLESCALTHKDAPTRLACLRALKPLGRRLAATQRVIIEIYRRDAAADVRAEASEQMLYFTGLSQKEAILAWLERAALGDVAAPLAGLGDLPNLDMVIARCLTAPRPQYERSKAACLELTKPLGPARRQSLLWPFLKELNPESPYYLEGAGAREGSIGTDWQRAVEAVLEGASRFPPELAEILWRRYERTLSSSALDALSEVAEPSETLARRLLNVLETDGARDALLGLERIGREAPGLTPLIRDRIAELLVTNAFNKAVGKADLERIQKKLEPPKSSEGRTP